MAIFRLNFFVLVWVFSISVWASTPPPQLLQQINSSYICLFGEQVDNSRVPQVAKEAVSRAKGKLRHIFNTGVRGFSAHMSAKAVDQLMSHNPNITLCEANGLTQAGSKGGKGGKPGQQTMQLTPENITLTGGPVDGSGLTAWIIDSGIDTNHPDLNVGLEDGANFVRLGKNTIEDGNGHGTHIAGTLAALDNDIDVVGVAAGARVVPVRVLHNSNFGAIDDMVAGILYVRANGSPDDVANMSVWAYGHYQSLHAATEELASVMPFVIIAGNDGEDINERPSEPSHVEHANVFTVSAVDMQGLFTDFSNFGHASQWTNCDSEYPADPFPCASADVAAYGKDIISLKPGGGLATWYGTSMAAPHVAGVILINRNASSSGSAINDPDGVNDPIVHF